MGGVCGTSSIGHRGPRSLSGLSFYFLKMGHCAVCVVCWWFFFRVQRVRTWLLGAFTQQIHFISYTTTSAPISIYQEIKSKGSLCLSAAALLLTAGGWPAGGGLSALFCSISWLLAFFSAMQMPLHLRHTPGLNRRNRNSVCGRCERRQTCHRIEERTGNICFKIRYVSAWQL